MMIKSILDELDVMFPNASCELEFNNDYELLVAVMLSAQTTDKKVNSVTKFLFNKYPNALKQSVANIDEVIDIIHPLGLANTKARNLIALAQLVIDCVPDNYDDLVKLPGIGRKCANVILATIYNVPRIPVDTHVYRVSRRLGIAKSTSILGVEKELEEIVDEERRILFHHQMIQLGRNICIARNPKCNLCRVKNFCQTFKV